MYFVVYLALAVSASVLELPDGSIISGKSFQSSISGTEVEAYIGIPFAEPPVGELRFRPPQPLKQKWAKNQRFGELRTGCFTGKEGTSEDCLYLNVYRPKNVSSLEPLPVMVWIYGGGFTSGKVDLYDGTELAARNNVIVVVPAYRLGAFGFLASNATFQESGTTGNWGFMDQQFALRWVQTNIASFLGDPSKVVLFGHSAGAMSVAAHLVSRNSQGLFSSAILSSATTSSDFFFQDRTDSTRFSSWVATVLARCPSLEDTDCLRRVPASRLVISDGHRDVDPPEWASRLFPSMPWGLTIDGTTLEGKPLDLARVGKAAKVPVIIGVTEDEGSLFSLALSSFIRPSYRGDIPASIIENVTVHLVGDVSFARNLMKDFASLNPTVLPAASVVPPKSAEEPQKKKMKLIKEILSLQSEDVSTMTRENILGLVPSLRDLSEESSIMIAAYDKGPLNFFKSALKECIFSCSSLAFADALQQHGNQVWFYNFALDVWADTPWHKAATSAVASGGSNMTVADLGAYHGAELPFIFNLFPDVSTTPNDFSNPLMLFKGFTGKQFCAQDSFKRRVATEIGCMWASMAKCGAPQCESSCGLDSTWENFNRKSVLNIHGRGLYTMRAIPAEDTGLEFLPSETKCAKWNDLKIPFHKFDSDVTPPKVLSSDSAVNSAKDRPYCIWLGALLMLLALRIV